MPPKKRIAPPTATQQLSLTDGLLFAEAGVQAFWSVTDVLALLTEAIDTHALLGENLTVRGELSNVRPASSGHVYATLKDAGASLSVVLWRSTVQKLPFKLEDGQMVLATGKLNVYAPGGSVSMVVQTVTPEGLGALQLAFEQLKAELTAQGLFDPDRKQPLPVFPMRVGLVTSATGAVIHDMWRVIRQKNPLVTGVLHPVAVQGDGAADQIAAAITRLNEPHWRLDALIVARGGGSFEDLFCFSQASVVQAIAASRLPVVTGIGHQPDFALADAAADYSAATPTAAADALVPNVSAWQTWVTDQQDWLRQQLEHRVFTANQHVDATTDQLHWLMQQHSQQQGQTVARLTEALTQAMGLCQQNAEQQLHTLADSLHQLSPLATLARGYAHVADAKTGQTLASVVQVKPQQRVSIRLRDGLLQARIETVTVG
jgi:exodeoxyribonuclease VII large subunit